MTITPSLLVGQPEVIKKIERRYYRKRAHYMYLQGSKTLILRFPNDENRPVTQLPGATLMFKKNLHNKIRFPNQNVGEDDLLHEKQA